MHGVSRGDVAARCLHAARAGLVGALAYLLAQELDRRLGNPRSNDLVLLGGLVTRQERLWRPLGFFMHLAAGAAFGVLFDAVAAPRLPGPYWLRGVAMAQIENVVLWPLVAVFDRIHPAIEHGELAPLNRPIYVAQAIWRHLALGVAVGALLGPSRDPDSPSEAA